MLLEKRRGSTIKKGKDCKSVSDYKIVSIESLHRENDKIMMNNTTALLDWKF
jgi:hypothetical protein